MKLPSKGSRGEFVLGCLYQASSTLSQGIERHGNWGMEHRKVAMLYDSLVDNGCANLVGDVYSISIKARNYLDGCHKKASPPAGIVAGPAYRQEPRPLKTTSFRLREMRPGAFDYQNVPSRMGDESVPYHTSLHVEA